MLKERQVIDTIDIPQIGRKERERERERERDRERETDRETERNHFGSVWLIYLVIFNCRSNVLGPSFNSNRSSGSTDCRMSRGSVDSRTCRGSVDL